MILTGRYRTGPVPAVSFGPGSTAGLAEALDAQNVTRALVITGKSLGGNAALMRKLLDAAEGRIAAIVDDARVHSSCEDALRLAQKASEADADGLISFGGGSANDLMKLVALILAAGVRDIAGLARHRMRMEPGGGAPAFRSEIMPTFAVPTTLSAGEFSPFTSAIDPDSSAKMLFYDSRLTARAVFLDPELTVATPETLWLSSGIKAIDHCIESLLSVKAQPHTDALVSHALSILPHALRRSWSDPADLDARGDCQIASWLSFCSGDNVIMGLSHGIGIMLGARYGVPHGVTSCVLLPSVMAYLAEATLERQAWIARILGVEVPGNDRASAKAAQDELRKLVRDDLGLPWRMRDVGVPRDAVEQIAGDVLGGYLPSLSRRPIRSEAEIRELIAGCW